jgi:hypothetical protein
MNGTSAENKSFRRVCDLSPPRLWPFCEMGLLIGQRRDSYPASNKWLTLLAGGDFDGSLIVEPAPLRHAPPPAVNIAPLANWRSELE